MRAFTISSDKLPENAILVARAMGPAALLDYQRQRLRGLVLEEGGSTSHVAIVARALGIPTVGRVEGIVGLVEQGDAIIVDGTTGGCRCAPRRMSNPPMPKKAVCGPAGRSNIALCVTSLRGRRMALESTCR